MKECLSREMRRCNFTNGCISAGVEFPLAITSPLEFPAFVCNNSEEVEASVNGWEAAGGLAEMHSRPPLGIQSKCTKLRGELMQASISKSCSHAIYGIQNEELIMI